MYTYNVFEITMYIFNLITHQNDNLFELRLKSILPEQVTTIHCYNLQHD